MGQAGFPGSTTWPRDQDRLVLDEFPSASPRTRASPAWPPWRRRRVGTLARGGGARGGRPVKNQDGPGEEPAVGESGARTRGGQREAWAMIPQLIAVLIHCLQDSPQLSWSLSVPRAGCENRGKSGRTGRRPHRSLATAHESMLTLGASGRSANLQVAPAQRGPMGRPGLPRDLDARYRRKSGGAQGAPPESKPVPGNTASACERVAAAKLLRSHLRSPGSSHGGSLGTWSEIQEVGSAPRASPPSPNLMQMRECAARLEGRCGGRGCSRSTCLSLGQVSMRGALLGTDARRR